MANQRLRKEYVPRQAQKASPTMMKVPEENSPEMTGMSGLTVHYNICLVRLVRGLWSKYMYNV